MKPWGGRFKDGTDPLLERFSASIDFDRKLYHHDIEGSKAHAQMLERIGIITEEETKEIIKGLDEIEKEIESGTFQFSDALEDIHMHIETRLIAKTEAGKKLHTGRSRNDQISLDMRLFLKDELKGLDEDLAGLLSAVLRKAETQIEVIMPGYTHLQRAQVVPLSHYLLGHYYALKRDRARLKAARMTADVLPLGSGALAGSTIPLDREWVRKKLGFARVSENSMDTVADRDFIMDAVYAAAMIMTHLSRFAEDLILFTTQEYAFISLPDKLTTGSSLMPHKKNPDALELIRGKTGRVLGDIFGLFAILKGLPFTYNRDLQEDKEPMFHAIETARDALAIMTLCIDGLTVLKDNMEKAAEESFMPAVELAEYLTIKGMPFREAHGIAGTAVRQCEESGILLDQMPLARLKKLSPLFEKDVFEYIKPRNAVRMRKSKGSASFDEVKKAIDAEKKYLGF
ncbi:MAG: argininosuccinate lyase [Syntrophorhabdaceae bacterium]|nr:argininosuccinate lyase [Syntrophorhabdaceae bacterium]MDD4196171.1 argininosuccinate lyase [Syntrophorhabdaceae bacterium]